MKAGSLPPYLDPFVRGVIDALAVVGGLYAFISLLRWAWAIVS